MQRDVEGSTLDAQGGPGAPDRACPGGFARRNRDELHEIRISRSAARPPAAPASAARLAGRRPRRLLVAREGNHTPRSMAPPHLAPSREQLEPRLSLCSSRPRAGSPSVTRDSEQDPSYPSRLRHGPSRRRRPVQRRWRWARGPLDGSPRSGEPPPRCRRRSPLARGICVANQSAVRGAQRSRHSRLLKTAALTSLESADWIRDEAGTQRRLFQLPPSAFQLSFNSTNGSVAALAF